MKMKMNRPHLLLGTLALVTLAFFKAQAGVTRIEIISRADLLNGKEFGLAGAYEKIVAKVHFAVDPNNPHNKVIVDIDKAPRNEQGLVEFSADLYILASPSRPATPAHFRHSSTRPTFSLSQTWSRLTLRRARKTAY
jgi:hypothetical protein